MSGCVGRCCHLPRWLPSATCVHSQRAVIMATSFPHTSRDQQPWARDAWEGCECLGSTGWIFARESLPRYGHEVLENLN